MHSRPTSSSFLFPPELCAGSDGTCAAFSLRGATSEEFLSFLHLAGGSGCASVRGTGCDGTSAASLPLSCTASEELLSFFFRLAGGAGRHDSSQEAGASCARLISGGAMMLFFAINILETKNQRCAQKGFLCLEQNYIHK